jgi:hypothetical protein
MTTASAIKITRVAMIRAACTEGKTYLKSHATVADAWDACTQLDYLFWALDKCELHDEKKDRLFACWCARYTPLCDGRTNWDNLTDMRSREAVEVAERFAKGEASESELESAESAAWSAARSAAWSARSAARSAAWSAAESARSAAWSAAESARSAARSAAWSAAESAAESARSAHCNALREIYGNPFREAGI